MRALMRIFSIVMLMAGLVAFNPANPTAAAGIVGTGTPASCTEAALDAALTGGGLVSFNCGPGNHTITITSEKIISANTTVDGGGSTTIDGQGQTRLFWVASNATLNLTGLTLTGGNGAGASDMDRGGVVFTQYGTIHISNSTLSGNSALSGGAIRVVSGTVTISNSTISDNSADRGGAIRSSSVGTVTVSNSTVSGNRGDSRAGGIDASGASTVTVTNSTISGNETDGGGGGIRPSSGSTITITNSTISGNSAGTGGGINNAGASVNIQNSIIANSIGGNCAGGVSSQDYNLSDDATCNFNQGNDLNSTPANLAPLGNYGGPTQTHHPLLSSQALNTGTCLTPTDQRGVGRPQNGICDRGSVEALPLTLLSSLCVNFYTGAVTSLFSGQCGAGQWQITQPSPYPLSFCINPYTGQVSYAFSGSCTAPRILHVVPDDGALVLCWNHYTGALRYVFDPAYCSFPAEPPVLIQFAGGAG